MAREMLLSSTHFPLRVKRPINPTLPHSLRVGWEFQLAGGLPGREPGVWALLPSPYSWAAVPGLPWFGAEGVWAAQEFTESRTSHLVWSPTTEASYVDTTNMSFIIEMQLNPSSHLGKEELGRGCWPLSMSLKQFVQPLIALNLLRPTVVSHSQACLPLPKAYLDK